MNPRLGTIDLLFLLLFLGLAGLPAPAEEPGPASAALPVFTTLTFDQARQRTEASGTILLVDAMATWCPPCRKMEETTWQDPQVLGWIASHGLAVQFNVDTESGLAERLQIEAMPTLLIFRGGIEIDRVTGFQDAPTLIGWLDAVSHGKTHAQMLEEKAAQSKGKGVAEVEARMEMARTYLERGEDARALAEYRWLWEQIPTQAPDFHGVRYSFLVDEMRELAEGYEPARSAFLELRTALTAKVEALTCTRPEFRDWEALNRVLGEGSLTIAWFDRVKAQPAAAPLIETVGNDLALYLSDQGRYAEAGRLFQDPVDDAKDRIEALTDPDPAETTRLILKIVGKRYAWLVAAGRHSEAAQVAQLILEAVGKSPANKVELIRAALKGAATHPEHAAWIEEAATAGMDVKDLRDELAKHPPVPAVAGPLPK